MNNLVKDKDTYIDVGRDGEIITNSVLTKYDWPLVDPRLGAIKERILSAEDANMLSAACEPYRFNLRSFITASNGSSVSVVLLELFNHRAFQFNCRERFRQCAAIVGQIDAACEECRPIEIVIPIFCVIGNPVKRLQPTLVTAGEEVSLRYLGEIAKIVQTIYPIGVIFHVVSDSTFYALPFGVTSVEAQNYIRSLRNCVASLGLDHCINVHDMSDIMAPHLDRFQERFNYWWRKLLRDPFADGISKVSYGQWLASAMASINTRRMGLDYEEMRAIFGGASQISQGNDKAGKIYKMAQKGLAEYRSLKAAIADIQWNALCFPGAIRATIHTKGSPVLGLRIYPEYKYCSTLLPYHGIAVLTYSEKAGRYRMSIQPELLVLGRHNVVRVVNNEGVTWFYQDVRYGYA